MVDNPAHDKGLQNYLSDIADIDPLPRKKEKELLIKAQEGDKEAMDELVRSNLKFVVKVATKFQGRGLSLSELISEGNLGLIKAINKFDTSRETKLITYAVWWIQQAIRYAVYEKSQLIRIPSKAVSTLNKIKSAKQRHKAQEGEEATVGEIAKEVDINRSKAKSLMKQDRDVVSLDKIYGEDNALGRMNAHQISDKESFYSENIDPKKIYYKKKLRDRINKKIDELSPRDARIIKEYFGFGEEDKGKNFAQIARQIGLSRERVRQIYKKIIEDLRKEAVNEVDIDYLLDL